MTQSAAPVDLFEDYESQPEALAELTSALSDELEMGEGDAYAVCKAYREKVNALGYDFEYGLEGVPYDLHKV